MFDRDRWDEIFSTIRKHKLRTGLTALGVFWGIFMLVLLLGAGKGLENGLEYQFRDDAMNSIWIWPGTTSKAYKGLGEGRNIRFSNTDYDNLLQEIDGIDELTGRFYLSGDRVVKYKDKTLSFRLRSVHPGHQTLENTVIRSGRYLNDADLKGEKKVCVIGKIVAEEIFDKDEDPLGKFISIGGVSYTIIGEFFDSGGENEMRTIYIPITTAQKIYGGSDRVHQLMFTTDGLSLEEMSKAEDDVRALMASVHSFDPDDRRALWVNNTAENYQEFQGLFGAIRLFVWFVGIGSIIAGVISISNIMLILVKERTREIGIRKALGATPRSIISMILTESVFITSIAGYLGIVLSVLLLFALQGAETDYFRSPQINIWVAFQALLVLIVCGLLAGWIPARQAARINPIKAIKGD